MIDRSRCEFPNYAEVLSQDAPARCCGDEIARIPREFPRNARKDYSEPNALQLIIHLLMYHFHPVIFIIYYYFHDCLFVFIARIIYSVLPAIDFPFYAWNTMEHNE